ncbi:MAG TPA: hypothetical protein VK212_02575 [Lentimicrobium sp.]|nr:hypothetical protein [Lentimicrobium sp.]
MEYLEVIDKHRIREFLDLPGHLYKGDPNWISPLDNIVEGVFDPSKNIFFTHGEAIRWIFKDDNGRIAGRAAAFINRNKAYNFAQPTGGMGFFECTNDKKLAFFIFDTCREWLRSKGMEAMDGPVNFGENDNFWGLLVEGFTPPSFGMNYNFPYYKDFFEEYGFRPYFEQVTNHLDLTVPFPERFWKIADWIRQRPGYTFRHFKWKESEKFIDDFKKIYDDAWQFHENFTPIDKNVLREQLKDLKPVSEEQFIWYAYHNGEPIAFLVMIPDANQLLRYFNGKIGFFGKLKFLWLRNRKIFNRARITVMGVRTKYQKSGIESGIFWHMDKMMKNFPEYTEIELSWVGDFNPKMRQLHESVGGHFAKRHITYRYLFNTPGEAQKATEIPRDTKNKVID